MPKERLLLSAGAQYDIYRRPDFKEDDNDYARTFWLGGQWKFGEKLSVSARVEDNINENFKHRPVGRVVMNWSL